MLYLRARGPPARELSHQRARRRPHRAHLFNIIIKSPPRTRIAFRSCCVISRCGARCSRASGQAGGGACGRANGKDKRFPLNEFRAMAADDDDDDHDDVRDIVVAYKLRLCKVAAALVCRRRRRVEAAVVTNERLDDKFTRPPLNRHCQCRHTTKAPAESSRWSEHERTRSLLCASSFTSLSSTTTKLWKISARPLASF